MVHPDRLSMLFAPPQSPIIPARHVRVMYAHFQAAQRPCYRLGVIDAPPSSLRRSLARAWSWLTQRLLPD